MLGQGGANETEGRQKGTVAAPIGLGFARKRGGDGRLSAALEDCRITSDCDVWRERKRFFEKPKSWP